MIERLAAYAALDRLHALASGGRLADRAVGTALSVDISGFSALTEQLALSLGARDGAEALTRHLNAVYEVLVSEVHAHGGSVVGFAGDGFTAWLDESRGPVAARAVACGLAIQRRFAETAAGDPVRAALALRVAVATGPVRRFAVGDPEVYRLDVLAGATMTRLAAGDGLARSGEVVLDEATARAAEGILEAGEVRADEAGGRHVVARGSRSPADPDPWPELPAGLSAEDLRPWLLPSLWDSVCSGQGDAPTELRPAAALFMSFEGVDYDGDDQAGERLDDFVRRVQTILARYDGTLVQLTIGDKGSYLYAAFGAPVAHEDDAFRSVRAAVRLARTAAEPPIGGLRIGVSHGTMRVGAYGARARRTYGVLGDEVNLAARLMQKAVPGQPLFSGRIHRATRGVVHWGALPPVRVKGREEPVPVFKVLGARKDAAPPSSAIVGREDERMAFVWCLDRLADGSGGVLLLEGDAGLGKSRLVEELVAEAESRGLTVCPGTGDALERSRPFFAWRPTLATLLGLRQEDVARVPGARSETIGVGGLTRGLSGVAGRESAQGLVLGEEEQQRLRGLVAAAAPEMAPLAPLLNAVLRREMSETEQTRDMDAPVRAASTLDLLARLVRHAGRRGRAVVVFDDARFLDSASWALLERVAGAPGLLLVVAARPSGDAASPELVALRERSDTVAVRLRPLSAEEVVTVAARAVGAERLSRDLASLVVERAEGSPLVALELARSLLEGGRLGVTDGEARLTGAGGAAARLALPDSMEAIVLGRVDHLPPLARQLIKVASVIGRRFSFACLRHAMEALEGVPRDDRELASAAVILEKAGLVEPSAAEGEPTWTFSSGVTQEVIHRVMTSEQRRSLHAAVAEFYEAEAGESDLALLAHHWVEADQISRARPYLEEAAETALRGGAWAEAARLYGQLLEAPDDGAEAGEDGRRRRAGWQIRFAVARAGAGRVPEAREHARAALSLLGQKTGGSLAGSVLVSGLRDVVLRPLAPGPSRRAVLVDATEAYERLAELHYLSDDPVGGLREALRGLALALRTGQHAVRARLQSAVALALGVAPLHAVSGSLMRGALAAARSTGDPATVGLVSQFAALRAFGLGRWSEARELVLQALEGYEALGNRHRLLELRNTLAAMAYTRGELALAGSLFADLSRDAAATGNGRARSWAEVGQALVAFRTGDSALGLRLLGTRRVATVQPLARLHLGETRQALEALPAALALARGRPIKCWTLERFALPAEVVLALREADSGLTADERARLLGMEGEALAAARRFARVFPIGEPREARLRGLSHWLGGRRRQALRAWQASLAAAQRLEMPWDEAHARLEIARHAADRSAEQAEHLDRATRLLEEAGTFDDPTRPRRGSRPGGSPSGPGRTAGPRAG